MAYFDGNDEYFDSREVIERIAELEDIEVIDREPEDQDELDALHALQDEAKDYIPDWEYGETFYTWDAFVEYAEETIRECYGIGDLGDWVTDHINWTGVAEEMSQDYTQFEFRGTTYYAR